MADRLLGRLARFPPADLAAGAEDTRTGARLAGPETRVKALDEDVVERLKAAVAAPRP